MKKTIQLGLLPALFVLSVLITPAKAQDVKKELQGFTKKFQEAYNKKDDKALKAMYTGDAARTDTKGNIVTGNDNIVGEFIKSWTTSDLKIEIKPETAETQTDGTVITTGTYQVSGAAKSGEKIDLKGSYTNTLVKEKGDWKITKSVLVSL